MAESGLSGKVEHGRREGSELTDDLHSLPFRGVRLEDQTSISYMGLTLTLAELTGLNNPETLPS